MKRLICLLSICIFLSGCSAEAIVMDDENIYNNKYFVVSKINITANNPIVEDRPKEMRGVWISQFDMHPIYRDGNKQRDKDNYTRLVRQMVDNLTQDGFNTIFLQLRPNGDSMFESNIYPTSKYIAGEYGAALQYDAISIFLEIAKSQGISVHGWINPFRLCTKTELLKYGQGILFEWYSEGLGKRIEIGDNDILYLDPAYQEATDLIVSGVIEILGKYELDGIHLDDYFYPTEFSFEDQSEYLLSGIENKSDFRRENINRTVKAIYDATHNYGKIFGVSPAGNIYSLSEGWYVDIYRWCSSDGYVDYIMPQLYFGFENSTCPFEKILSDWSNAVTSPSVSLYIGLSAAKCELGSMGIEDNYAGNGKFEWMENNDILNRSLLTIRSCNNASGFCIFSYSSFYDPITGNDNENIIEEKSAFCQLLN